MAVADAGAVDEEVLWSSGDGQYLPRRILLKDNRGRIRLISRAIGGSETYVEIMPPRSASEVVALATCVLDGVELRQPTTLTRTCLAAAVVELFIENMELRERTQNPPPDLLAGD